MTEYVGSEAAEKLKGLTMWGGNWAADMFMLQFGGPVQRFNFKGKSYLGGELALHLQCAWRFTFANKILIGSTDFFNNSNEGGDIAADLNAGNYPWNGETPEPPAELIKFFMSSKTALGFVKEIQAYHAGAFSLELSSGYTFDVFPVLASNNNEQWRILQPSGDHFVCGEPCDPEE